MSEIARWKKWDSPMLQDVAGQWVRYDSHRAEVERLTAERDAAQAEVKRLTEQVGALTLALEQADEMKAHAEAAAAAEEAETDRVTAERDAAQAEVERLKANGQAILDSSRPTDEDIWREIWLLGAREHRKAAEWADAMLAEYRKRWPR